MCAYYQFWLVPAPQLPYLHQSHGNLTRIFLNLGQKVTRDGQAMNEEDSLMKDDDGPRFYLRETEEVSS